MATKSKKKKVATSKKSAARPSAPRGRESKAAKIDRAAAIYKKLRRRYPDAHCALTHRDPYELLMATILSAQCTDERVNMVTPPLFAKYPKASDLARASQADVEKLVHSTGFYRNKAKNLIGAAQGITRDHKGQVPDEMDPLLELPGVARKTANVVLGNAYNKNEGVVVDTHVKRLTGRMGLTTKTNPVHVEQDLITLFPSKKWCMLSHLLIFHGRQTCDARKPKCDNCVLADLCPKVGV
jgi:endonuclease-3